MTPTKEELARHEAAHFTVAWAVGCPALQSDITEAAHKVHADGSKTLGVTDGYVGRPTPFEHILTGLAGIVADHWELPNIEIIKDDAGQIEAVVADMAGGDPLDRDDGDWDEILREMLLYGIDVLDAKPRNDALMLFLDAVRSILNICGENWKDAAAYLAEHGRIGFNGNYPDQGEGAGQFFTRWENEDGEVPGGVKSIIKTCEKGGRK